MIKIYLRIFAALVAILISPISAQAQKADDKLRLSTIEFLSALDYYHDPSSEFEQFVRNVYGYLVVYDERSGQFIPELAKAWRRIDEKTWEFDLRDDIVFHSGNKFTAQDVKETIDYLIDPKTTIRFQGRYDWVRTVEVLSPYKVRIVSKEPFAEDLHSISYRFYFYDSAVFRSLADKADYGRVSASATGPYRAISVDKNAGLLVERFDAAVGKWDHRRAPIKRILSVPVPDRQVQLAKLMTREVDAIRNITPDMQEQILKISGLAITPVNSKFLVYMTLDAAGRSANKVFTNKLVRQAFFKAIPRDLLRQKFISAPEIAELPNGICFKSTVACDPTQPVIEYDLEGAKRLLAEAGYPNGIDIVITGTDQYRDITLAAAGELRKAGIRANVEFAPRTAAVRRRGHGELTVYGSAYPTFSEPTVTNLMDFFFGGERDYTGDPMIAQATAKATVEFDLAKRTAIYREVLNRVNSEAYVYPMTEYPTLWAHWNYLSPQANPHTIAAFNIGDWFWK